ncbi:MAG TPA: hypothetical protein VE258_13430 [Ktedonobacterales bacterium]|nr:hypothetical protein [Ktedonobacterales bacterium]
MAESSPPKTVTVSALPAAEPAQPDADKELAQRVVRAIDAAKLHGIDVVAVSGVVTLWVPRPAPKNATAPVGSPRRSRA